MHSSVSVHLSSSCGVAVAFFFFLVFFTMREILNQNIIVHVLGFVSCKYGYEILSSHVAMSLIFILL